MASSLSISAEAVPPNWVELPREITSAILHKLGPFEILTSAQKVCTTWRRVCRDPSMWRRILVRYTRSFRERPFGPGRMCREAVDLSQGQLTDFTITFGCTDGLLLYISHRSCWLRRLQLVNSYFTGAGFKEAMKCFPLLEELLLHNKLIDAEAIEIVGLHCPLLSSFKLNFEKFCAWYEERDLHALTVARNMPQLRHLQLIGNSITNEGLQAILDGCLHLESLDLRWCSNVRIVGHLRKLCLQRVKELRLPEDSMNDYPFAGATSILLLIDMDNLNIDKFDAVGYEFLLG